MNGVLVLDKPRGITSQAALNAVNKILNVERTGHTGTLDPFATGVLPICVNKATKIIPYLNSKVKIYEALLELGTSTDTLDPTGAVLESKSVGEISENALNDVFSEFKGKITQMPPMFSAIKKDGVRLYRYARKGVEVERRSREITIWELDLVDMDLPNVRFMVKCSRGTYVRVLAADIARRLDTVGHLAELRRIESDGFNIKNAVTIEDLKNGDIELTSLNDALSHMSKIQISESLTKLIREGKQIKKSDLDRFEVPAFSRGDNIKLYRNDELISITEALEDFADLNFLESDSIVLKLQRVFN